MNACLLPHPRFWTAALLSTATLALAILPWLGNIAKPDCTEKAICRSGGVYIRLFVCVWIDATMQTCEADQSLPNRRKDMRGNLVNQELHLFA